MSNPLPMTMRDFGWRQLLWYSTSFIICTYLTRRRCEPEVTNVIDEQQISLARRRRRRPSSNIHDSVAGRIVAVCETLRHAVYTTDGRLKKLLGCFESNRKLMFVVIFCVLVYRPTCLFCRYVLACPACLRGPSCLISMK